MTPKISQKPVANGLLALFLLGTTPSAISQSDTWSGSSSSDWGTASNWLNGSVPGSADGQSATFDTSVTPGTGNGNVTLSGNVGVGDIIFSGNGSTSYDLGVTGGTLNLADNGDVTVNATVEVNQIISANIVLGDGTATTNQITNLNTTASNTLLLAGDLIAPANATGTVRMDFGNFNTTLDRIDISGDVYYNGAGAAGADRFDLFLAGANMTLSGNAAVTRDDTTNKVRTYLRYGTVLTVEGANGRLGSGNLQNRWGTLNLNNSNSTFRSTFTLGDPTQGNGDAIVNIADGQTMQLFSGITYLADSINDNQGFINGGNITISGANRTIIVQENPLLAADEPELTINSDLLNDGQDRDLNIRDRDNNLDDGGTILLTGNNTHGGVNVTQTTLWLGSDQAIGGGNGSNLDFLNIITRNNAQTQEGETGTVDLRGFDARVTSMTLGSSTTTNISGNNLYQPSLVDTVGGGTLRLRSVNYNAGGSVANTSDVKPNAGGVIDADIVIEENASANSTTRTWTIHDSNATTAQITTGNTTTDSLYADLRVSGDITSEIDSNNSVTRTGLITQGKGSLILSGSNSYGQSIFQNSYVRLVGPNALPDDSLADGSGANVFHNLTIRGANSTNALNRVDSVTLDLFGNDIDVRLLRIGHTNSSQYEAAGQDVSYRIIDSTDSGAKINLNQNIVYEDGSGTSTVTRFLGGNIEVDIDLNGGNRTFTVRDGLTNRANTGLGTNDYDLEISGKITGFRASDSSALYNINKNGAGVLKLTNESNTFNQLLVTDGKVIATNAGVFGDSAIRVGGGNLGGNNTLNGTLEFKHTTAPVIVNQNIQVGEHTNATNSKVEDTGSGTILNNGSNPVEFTHPFFIGVDNDTLAARSLTLGGNNTGDNIIKGRLRNHTNNASLSLIKEGSGHWILSGESIRAGEQTDYSGSTTISEGRLDIYGGTNISSGGLVSIADGASIGGDATFGSNITFSGNIGLFVDATTPTVALGTIGGSNNGGGANITVTIEGTGGDASGNIVVYDYAGTLGGGNNSLTFGDFQSTVQAANISNRGGGSTTLLNDTTNGYLYVNLGYASRTWNGSTNNAWDSTGNWVEGDNKYYDGDIVTFDDTPGSNQTLTIDQNPPGVPPAPFVVTPGEIRFTNDTITYTLNDNTIDLTGGDLVKSGNATVTINSTIVGTGSIIKGNPNNVDDNAAQLILNGNNTYSGGTLISEGYVRTQAADSNFTPFGTGAITMTDGGGINEDPRLFLQTADMTIANDFVILDDGNGKRIHVTVGNVTISGDIDNGEVGFNNFLIDVDNNDDLTITGRITGEGGLRKLDRGELTLTDTSNSFANNLVLNRGTLNFTKFGNEGENSSIGSGGIIVLGENSQTADLATLNYSGGGDSSDRKFQIGDRQGNANNNTTGGGVIQNSGSGALVFTNSNFNVKENDAAVRISSRTLGLAGNATSSAVNEIEGTIIDNTPNDATITDETVALSVTSGIWQLSGDSSTNAEGFSGGVSVTGANTTLLVNNSFGSGVGFGNVTVGSDGSAARLGGSGTVFAVNSTSNNAANLATRSTLSIGANATHTAGAITAAGFVGQQTIAGNLSYGNSATVAWDLVANSTTNPGTNYDQFVVNNGGSISFDSALNLEIVFGSGVDFENSFWNTAGTNEWEIWNGTVSDVSAITFSLSEDSAAENEQYFTASAFEISNDNFGGTDTGQGVWLRQLAAIPEPSTFSLLGLGLAGFGWFARRRRNRQSVS